MTWAWAALALLGTVSGVSVCAAVSGRPPPAVDRRGLMLGVRARNPVATTLAKGLGVVASPWTLGTVGLVGAAFARAPADRVRLVGAALLRPIYEKLGKRLCTRARPPSALQLGAKRGTSIPSGHAMSIAAFLLFATTFGGQPARSTAARGSALAAAILGAATIGASRVYLAKHWATDVLAGLLLGTGGAAMVEIGARAIETLSSPSSAAGAS